MSRRQLLIWVAALCAAYLLLQLVYISHLPLVMDEFQGAAMVALFRDELPYRDFRPYKTVLGYYFQLPALLLSSDPWTSLLAVKLQAAATTALALGGAALALARRFRREAVVLGLLLLVPMSTFLERSADLRVDMLTALAGLASLLVLISGRAGLAGALAGVGFLVSQKGVYFVLAGGAALCAALAFDGRSRREAWSIVRFGAAASGVIVLYVVLWGSVAPMSAVLEAVFLVPGQVALGEEYDIRGRFWMQTLSRNPLFYASTVPALLALVARRRRPAWRGPATVLLAYGTTLIALCIWHKQPWPYFFVLLIPTLFVLHVSLFDAMLGASWTARRSRELATLLLLLGVAIPLRRVSDVLKRENGMQRHTIRLAHALLEPDETYLAGMHLLHDRRQAVDSLQWLDTPRRKRLRERDEAALLPLLDEMRRARMKVVVDNSRVTSLPPLLRDYIRRNYAHYAGNVLLYAPQADPGERSLALAFGGTYRIAAAGPVRIDGRQVADGERIALAAGEHDVEASSPFRLVLEPPGVEAMVDERYRGTRSLFPRIYDY